MNTFTITQRKITARFYAGLTILSLLLTAFPAAFFVAEAARTGVDITTLDSFTVQLDEGARLQAQVEDDGDKSDTAVITLTDGASGGIFMNINGNNCSSDLGVGPQDLTVNSGSLNKNFCYKNSTPGLYTVTVELFVADQVIGSDTIGVVVMEASPDDRNINICKWNGHDYIPQSVNRNSIGTGHGNSGVNQGDIIPPVLDEFPDGFNWDWGQAWLDNNCEDPDPNPSLTITNPATDGQILSGEYSFEAEYVDEDNDDDTMRWAIRSATAECNGGTTFAGGNISGWNNPSAFDGASFGALVDMSSWDNGEYCFVVNPDGSGEELRKFRPFSLENETLTVPNVCSYAGEVIDYSDPAYKNGGALVAANRRLVSAVEAGVAPYANFFGKEENDWQVSPLDFFSLGIEGYLVYEFTDQIVVDQPGDDIAVWEITGGDADEQSDEAAEVLVSQDGITFVSVGVVTGDGAVDISSSGLDFVKYVKVVDQSIGVQGSNGDGYDVDAVTIIDGSCSDYATIITEKIVCTEETDLPNDANGSLLRPITSDTAQKWVDEHDSCSLVDGWEFEWAPKGTSDPGDTLVGSAGSDWTTFTGSTNVPGSVLDDGYFWMREVLQSDYLTFSHSPAGNNNSNDVTAEMYCSTDVKNYDNFDRVDDPQSGETYYCVAWNVPTELEPTKCTVTLTSDDTNTVEEKDGAFATVLSFIHDNWTTALANADWIWGDDGPTNPSQPETQTFLNQFGWGGDTVLDATLTIAADNTFSASLNSNPAAQSLVANNFSTVVPYDVTGLVQSGNNELKVIVENLAGSANPEDNPAGLYYELVINGEGENCDVPYVPEPEEPEYGPYCGDGVVQNDGEDSWEQCDDEGASDTCTEACTLANQCSAEQLIKITLDDTDSVSFDGLIYLGSDTNPIPNGTWFNFNQAGDNYFVTTANAVDGLAVQRDTVNGKLALGFVGGNSSKSLDYVQGDIMTLGIDLGAVDRKPDPNPSTKFVLENSGEGFVDVFTKNPADTAVDFDLRADTGNDGVTVEIGIGEEHGYCPDCLAEVEARIILNDSGVAGDGDLSAEIILGDDGYTTVEFGEWFPISVAAAPGDSAVMINDPNTVTNFDSPADKPGLFVSRENGTVKVALYGKHSPGGNTNNEWIDARIEINDAGITNFQELTGLYKFENHPVSTAVPTNNGYDVAVADGTGVDFKMWVDTGSDGFRFDIDGDSVVTCEDNTDPEDPADPKPENYVISGNKQELEGETSSFLAGWTINLTDGSGEFIKEAVTNDEGYYSFTVPAGTYQVHEVMQTDWTQVSVYQDDSLVETDSDVENCEFDIPDESDYSCDFINEFTSDTEPEPVLGCTDSTAQNYNSEATEGNEDANACTYEQIAENTGGSSSGGRRRIQQLQPTPLVLGASTSLCPILTDYMQMGADNDTMEVMKLQMFLNIFVAPNPITGTFGAITDANVKAFQEQYRSEILDPWFDRGIVPHNRPTGFVYKTTLWKINSIVCPDVTNLPNLEGEDLTKNTDLNLPKISDQLFSLCLSKKTLLPGLFVLII